MEEEYKPKTHLERIPSEILYMILSYQTDIEDVYKYLKLDNPLYSDLIKLSVTKLTSKKLIQMDLKDIMEFKKLVSVDNIVFTVSSIEDLLLIKDLNKQLSCAIIINGGLKMSDKELIDYYYKFFTTYLQSEHKGKMVLGFKRDGTQFYEYNLIENKTIFFGEMDQTIDSLQLIKSLLKEYKYLDIRGITYDDENIDYLESLGVKLLFVDDEASIYNIFCILFLKLNLLTEQYK